jgi:hypothetical protein
MDVVVETLVTGIIVKEVPVVEERRRRREWKI